MKRHRVTLASIGIAVVLTAGGEAHALPQTWLTTGLGVHPAARSEPAMAFDTRRDVLVLFGGCVSYESYSCVPSADTWEWDGVAWTERLSDTWPPARFGAAIAYDAERGKVVLFGGCAVHACPADDTWEWDGTGWSQLTPAMSPPARFRPGAAFSAPLGETVVFGGGTHVGPLSDTWAWDGSTWRRMQTPGPSARSEPGLVYDVARARLVLFGGLGQTTLSDTWELRGERWVRLLPEVSPPPRVSFGMAPSARGGAVLFGGKTDDGTLLNDTWGWNGTNWAPIVTPTAPEPRFYFGMGVGSGHGSVMVIGGASDRFLDDEWVLTPGAIPL